MRGKSICLNTTIILVVSSIVLSACETNVTPENTISHSTQKQTVTSITEENSVINYETNLFSFSYNPDLFTVTQSDTEYGTVYKIDSDMIPEVDQDTYNTVLGILEYRSTFY